MIIDGVEYVPLAEVETMRRDFIAVINELSRLALAICQDAERRRAEGR